MKTSDHYTKSESPAPAPPCTASTRMFCNLCVCFSLKSIHDFTARKRSLGQGNVFTPVCHSVHRGCIPACNGRGCTPPGQTPPRQTSPRQTPLRQTPPWPDNPHLGRHYLPLGRQPPFVQTLPPPRDGN